MVRPRKLALNAVESVVLEVAWRRLSVVASLRSPSRNSFAKRAVAHSAEERALSCSPSPV
jgi:hypothetical protein